MTTILDNIIETKREQVATARGLIPVDSLKEMIGRVDPPRDFLSAVTAASPDGINLIAEIKRKSPSAGLIVPDFAPKTIAEAYHRARAAAISVLTDVTYFGGSLDFLAIVKEAVPLPVLRKDFLIDEYQLYESRAAGADAVLLIAEAIGADGIAAMLPLARQLGMAVLVEVHSMENLAAVLDRAGPPGEDYILGINNRDLAIQRTDLAATVRLGAMLPPATPFVAESGIGTRADVLTVRRAGACAILVGESLLKAPDMAAKIGELLGR